MRYTVLLCLAVIVVIALHMQNHIAHGFQFSLPGQWGAARKRGSRQFSFSLPGQWGNGMKKRSGDTCGTLDPETLRQMLGVLQDEALYVASCLEYYDMLKQAEGNDVSVPEK